MPAEAPAIAYNRYFLQLSNNVGCGGQGQGTGGSCAALGVPNRRVQALSWQPAGPCVTAATTARELLYGSAIGLAKPSAAESERCQRV